MKNIEAAQAAARLAVVNEKANAACDTLLKKWFAAQFVRGMKLPLLRAVFQAGAYPAFAQLLGEATNSDLSTILSKIDKYQPNQMQPRAKILEHMEALASGNIEPTPKPRAPRKSKAKSVKAPKKKVGIISDSKY